MALVSAASALAVTGTDTDAINYTTASWAPTIGKVYVAAFGVLDLGGATDLINTTVTGNNITWTRINRAGTVNDAVGAWWGYASATATAGALTFTGVVTAGQTADGAAWGIAELTNADITAPIVQSVIGSTANDTISVTLAAFSTTNNATAAVYMAYDNAGGVLTTTAGTGFANVIEGSQAAGGDTLRLAFEFRNDNDTSVTADAAAANDSLRLIAFEIRAGIFAENAAGAGTAQTPTASVGVAPSNASGTGTANQPAASIGSNAGNAAGTGTAYQPTAAIGATTPAGAATGTGTASNPAASIGATAGNASGTGTAYNPSPTVGAASNAGTASGTGTASNPGVAIDVNAGLASGVGTAYNPTVLIEYPGLIVPPATVPASGWTVPQSTKDYWDSEAQRLRLARDDDDILLLV